MRAFYGIEECVCAKFESFLYFKYEILHQLNFETDLRLFYHTE